MVINQVLNDLSAEHRRVVELCVFDGASAGDVRAAIDGMTEANAYQIVRRFRVRLREALGEGDA